MNNEMLFEQNSFQLILRCDCDGYTRAPFKHRWRHLCTRTNERRKERKKERKNRPKNNPKTERKILILKAKNLELENDESQSPNSYDKTV